ncbi:hypothetical protein [Microvirga aerophila]|uniref:Uncharacterized protein n=1 Tax=Microvirga aerophila TaxID=670291 RepID=A0A512C1I8_9HYPH|nr:hypothetical protein [Microvirga aerophila]GEO18078.1 hypothetical protein MAE02_57740 [Microvirga aerophila]
MSPEEQGRISGQEFARLAVDLRRKGLPVERWTEFMSHRMAALAREIADEADARTWAEACLAAYQDAIDNNMPSILLLLEPEGQA